MYYCPAHGSAGCGDSRQRLRRAFDSSADRALETVARRADAPSLESPAAQSGIHAGSRLRHRPQPASPGRTERRRRYQRALRAHGEGARAHGLHPGGILAGVGVQQAAAIRHHPPGSCRRTHDGGSGRRSAAEVHSTPAAARTAGLDLAAGGRLPERCDARRVHGFRPADAHLRPSGIRGATDVVVSVPAVGGPMVHLQRVRRREQTERLRRP
jgi:hypothetical protein